MAEVIKAPKIAVIYYSQTGTLYALAESVADGAREAGAEVRLLRVRELASEEVITRKPTWSAHLADTNHIDEARGKDVIWADGVIFGTPTRFGNIASQLKDFIDSLGGLWSRNLLADKVYSGFTAASTLHGGHESTLLALYTSLYHFGGIVVAPGYSDPVKLIDGNPYGVSHLVNHDDPQILDTTHHAARYQGARVSQIAGILAAGLR